MFGDHRRGKNRCMGNLPTKCYSENIYAYRQICAVLYVLYRMSVFRCTYTLVPHACIYVCVRVCAFRKVVCLCVIMPLACLHWFSFTQRLSLSAALAPCTALFARRQKNCGLMAHAACTQVHFRCSPRCCIFINYNINFRRPAIIMLCNDIHANNCDAAYL